MEKKTTHRIIGVLVVIALVVILMPLLFGGAHVGTTQTASVKAPPFPDQDEQTTPTRVASQSQDPANTNTSATTDPSNAPDANAITPPPPLTSADATAAAPQDPLHPQALADDTTSQSMNPTDSMNNNSANSQPAPQAITPPTNSLPSPEAVAQSTDSQQTLQSIPLQQQRQQGTMMPGQPMQQQGQQAPMPGQPFQPQSTQAPIPGQPLHPSAQQPMMGQPMMAPGQQSQQPGQQPLQQPTAQPQPQSSTEQQLQQQQQLQQPPLMQSPQQPAQPTSDATPTQPPVPNSLSQSLPTPISQTVVIHSDGTPSADTPTATNVVSTPTPAVNLDKVASVSTPHKKQNKPIIHQAHQAKGTIAELRQAGWVVQMGSFHNKDNAQRLANTLRAKGYKAFTREVKSSTRVYVGPEFKQASAESLADKIQHEMNMQGIVITYRPLEL